jgi:hypothetical protein
MLLLGVALMSKLRSLRRMSSVLMCLTVVMLVSITVTSAADPMPAAAPASSPETNPQAMPGAPVTPPDMRVELPPAMAALVDPEYSHYVCATKDGSAIYPDYPQASAAYKWLNVIEEVSARDVDKVGARPTILSRQMAIPLTAMYDAWAAYDEKAVGTRLGGKLRRPASERTQANKETAIAYATADALHYVFPDDKQYIDDQLKMMGYDPMNMVRDNSPAGIGHQAADAVIEYRKHDGSNQEANMPGTPDGGKPYADYTGYKPVNTADMVSDPDHWQPITFTVKGEKKTPGYLTPQWGNVKTFAMDSSSQFRPDGPPKADSPEMKREIAECIRYNAGLTPMQTAIVEFMRDGPRSTGQSGHWLRFAQDASRLHHYGLDDDVKLFFSVSNICMDTFIACWECKRYYDSSRPWTLIRTGTSVYLYDGGRIHGWKGPGQGVGAIDAAQWHPYSPENFITPPFPGYPSGHSTVSAGASTIIKLFTGSDLYGFTALRVPGCLTGEPQNDIVCLELPTWTATAEMAGISRVMGGYHIQKDNVDALALGRKIASFEWPKYQEYFNGTASVRP